MKPLQHSLRHLHSLPQNEDLILRTNTFDSKHNQLMQMVYVYADTQIPGKEYRSMTFRLPVRFYRLS